MSQRSFLAIIGFLAVGLTQFQAQNEPAAKATAKEAAELQRVLSENKRLKQEVKTPLEVSAEKAQPAEVRWIADYNLARKESQAKKLPLFLYFTFAECVHAKRFEKTTLRDPGVLTILSRNFVCAKIDVAQESALAKQFRINGCPTMVITTAAGKVLRTIAGYQETAPIAEMLAGVIGLEK